MASEGKVSRRGLLTGAGLIAGATMPRLEMLYRLLQRLTAKGDA